MIRLLFNADDFGIHAEVNAAIVDCCQRGVLTSTSLLAGGKAFEEAVQLLSSVPDLGVGIHTALVGGLEPVLPVEKVPSLVTEEGLFVDSHTTFIKKVMTGAINYNEVYAELDAQFEKIVSHGVDVTHVDGHQHMHVLPTIQPIIFSLMKKYGIYKLRLPEEKLFYLNGNYNPIRFIGKAGLSHYAHYAKPKARNLGFAYPRYFWGMMNGGHMTEDTVLSILESVKTRVGSHEIMVHPGRSNTVLAQNYSWQYMWEEEAKMLMSPRIKNWIQEHSIQLINYRDIS